MKRLLVHIIRCLKEPRDIIYHIKNIFLDIKMGGVPLGGTVKTHYANDGAKDTSNSSYQILQECFDKIEVNPDDILVDLGCGKGRVLQFWLNAYPDNKVIGIELDPDIAQDTRSRLKKYGNCSVLSGSVLDVLPVNGTIFFMFNPFDERVMKPLEEKLIEMDVKAIVYYNCVYVSVFEKTSGKLKDLILQAQNFSLQ